jgi:hypothetical protein
LDWKTVLNRCNKFAKLGTAACFLAVLLGALLCSIPPAEAYPRIASLAVMFSWWLAGSLVLFPLVAAVLWTSCASALLSAQAWRALAGRRR